MSLFGSIQMAKNALRAQQIGLQVVGQNISNANTPGYIREEVILSPAPTQRIGGLLLGLGVQVDAVVQKIDKFLEERLRNAKSDRVSNETKEQAYLELESILGELGDTDLSTALNNFFGSVHDVLSQPEDIGVRNLAILQGKTLTQDIRNLSERVREVRSDLNDKVKDNVLTINNLIEEIRTLNIRITATEGGDTTASDAVGLRDQRNLALGNLAGLIDIKSIEQPNGSINVFAGGDYLVFENSARFVEAKLDIDRGLAVADIRIIETDSALTANSGEIEGLVSSRDDVLGGFLDRLDDFSQAFIFEFNKLFSSGQGLKGHAELTSEFAISDSTVALDEAGLEFTPENGSFQVLVYNKQTKLTETTTIRVDLNGLDDDTSLDDLAAQLDAVSGLAASVDIDGHLQISSDSVELEFSFANDSSGTLAALGLNTFFTGSNALDIDVNSVVVADAAKFNASKSGIGADTNTATLLAAFLDAPLNSKNGSSLKVLYSSLTAEVTQGSSVARGIADGSRIFEQTLVGQQLATSGVSLDEEAVKMISYQRALQATSKYIKALDELLEVLVNL
jgi:flagellar hook-associated protein 1 FlgK